MHTYRSHNHTVENGLLSGSIWKKIALYAAIKGRETGGQERPGDRLLRRRKVLARPNNMPYEEVQAEKRGIKKKESIISQTKTFVCAPAVNRGWGFRGLDSQSLQRSCHNKLHIFVKSDSWERNLCSQQSSQSPLEHQPTWDQYKWLNDN